MTGMTAGNDFTKHPTKFYISTLTIKRQWKRCLFSFKKKLDKPLKQKVFETNASKTFKCYQMVAGAGFEPAAFGL